MCAVSSSELTIPMWRHTEREFMAICILTKILDTGKDFVIIDFEGDAAQHLK